MALAVEAEQLVKHFTGRGGTVEAVRGVDLQVEQGEVFGFLGPNGAGKSTTVRMLTTLMTITSGAARVAGIDVATEPDAVRRKIGVALQEAGLDSRQSGRELIVLQCLLFGSSTAQAKARAQELLELVDLVEAADRRIKGYSGGMKRRLDLAMGLVNEPAVLFLDEPTTGLDPETRAALWRDLIRLRKERNLTVLLTTHYLEEADQLCDRLAIVDHGKVVVEGTPAELKARISGDTVVLEAGSETERAAGLLKPIAGVLETFADGSRVIARVEHGASAMPALITALERAGIPVSSSTVSRPSLDDVYLHHTGRRFQGQGEAGSAGAPAGGGRNAGETPAEGGTGARSRDGREP
jgi:ABC-2 type transport system ATP-binding protein